VGADWFGSAFGHPLAGTGVNTKFAVEFDRREHSNETTAAIDWVLQAAITSERHWASNAAEIASSLQSEEN
jgi:hypothetical protein